MGMKYTDDECIEALQKAAEMLGKTPSKRQYQELGIQPSVSAITRAFGSWNDGKEAAGLTTLETGNRKAVNESYFYDINTPEKAYWFGFLLGDGSVYEYRDGHGFCLGITDEDHLREFKEEIESEHKVSVYESDEPNWKHKYSLYIVNEKFVGGLIQNGLGPDKTKSGSVPDLPKDLRPHLVRGLFDADGHQYENSWKITGASIDRLEAVKDWLPVEAYIHEQEDCADLLVSRQHRFQPLSEWLYPDGEYTNPKLDRKRF